MFLKNSIKLIGVLAVASVVWFLHQSSVSKASMTDEGAAGPAANAPAAPKADQDVFRGMAIQINYVSNGIEPYLEMIDEVAALGANTVGLSTAGYQDHAGSAGIFLDARWCPSKEQFKQLIARARSHGLKVAIMPVVLLKNPQDTEWRGVIKPPDWDAWFASYLEFIKYFAEVGLENDAEMLVVGAELISTEGFRERWTKLIGEIRKIYHGKLLYSSNWDHYREVSFWDQLDVIGMTTYHKLSDKENPPLTTLLGSWSKIKREILDWQKTVNKPILFTEVGWCSQPGASIEAWNYYRHQKPSAEGLEEQKKCYEAFIRTWDDEATVAGAMWWEWTPGPGGEADHGYTPKAKPAERVLRDWYQKGKVLRSAMRAEKTALEAEAQKN